MTGFDAVRAAREELYELNRIADLMRVREQHAEAAMGIAEAELMAVRKLLGYKLETPEQRLKLPVERNGFSVNVSPGVRLNYRRSARSSGTWSIKIADGKRSSVMRRLRTR